MESGRALLLIADIGGYTEYMSTHRMSLAHAEVTTARLLEKVIDAARGFDLIEIEGDAAFLSRKADALDGDAMLATATQAAVSMHRAFHIERQHVATNLCPCDWCAQADNLKLKFVAHVGEVATQTIKSSGASSSGSTSSSSTGCSRTPFRFPSTSSSPRLSTRVAAARCPCRSSRRI